MYEYSARLIKVVDGDTVWLDVDLGCDIHIKLSVRLNGINTPELPTDEGLAAKEFVSQWLNSQKQLTLHTIKDKKEKYGRYLGILYGDGNEPLNTVLLNEGHAVAY